MPKLNMEAAHELGREEAVRRLQDKFDLARANYGSQVSNLHEEWNDGELSFNFSVVGMKVSGKVSVEDAAVKLDAKIPLAAMMFKGMIEQRILDELGDLLA